MFERPLQLAIVVGAVLASVMLGMGQDQMTLTVVAVVVAISSVYLTDVRGWIVLRGPWVSAAGLLAAGLFAFNLMREGQEQLLPAWAKFLVYLQCVLFLQAKSVTVYRQLLLLAFVQVAVATALNFEPVFGLLLVTYLTAAVATLVLLFLWRETGQFAAAMVTTASLTDAGGATATGGRAPHAAQPAITRSTARHPAAPHAAGRRTAAPLSATSRAIGTRTASRPSPQVGFAATVAVSASAPLGWKLTGQVARIVVATLVVVPPLFFFIPRVAREPWQQVATSDARHVVGATESVQLGELGEIVESAEEVMRVQFFDHFSNTPLQLDNDPLFRGAQLTRYERGQWGHHFRRDLQPMSVERPTPTDHWVRQETTIEPLDVELLYAIFPVLLEERNAEIYFDRNRHQLLRQSRVQFQRFKYELLTLGIVDGRQARITPAKSRADDAASLRLLTDLPRDNSLDRLRAFAQDQVADLPNDWLARAEALEAYLRDDSRFQYTLRPPARDPRDDPVQDFVLEQPSGHCEYFASALALMLRSIGVPARLVIGFRGGEWNPLGNFYQVRQLHAHAWVEAYIRPQDLPGELRIETGEVALGWENGGWLILDPTPGADLVVPKLTDSAQWPTFQQWIEYGRFLWSSYVMGLDANRQLRTIYLPIVDAGQRAFRWLTDRRTWAAAAARLRSVASGDWLDWRAGLLAMMLCLAAVGAFRLAQMALRAAIAWYWRWVAARAAAGAAEVEFYRRLERLLARERFVRQRTQTQREFAQAAARWLEKRRLAPETARLPIDIVEAFYRVRFGRRDLDKQQSKAVEHALDQLQAALARAE